MELRQYLSVIWKWMWLVALSVGIAAGSSYLASKAATPLYRTKTTLMVGRINANTSTASMDLWTGQQLAYTYTQLAQREPVLKGAIDSLGLEMSWEALAGQVSASIVNQTQLLEVSVIDSDPYRAKVLADAIAQQLILLSPAGSAERSDQQQRVFAQAQLDDLKGKIEGSSDEYNRLRRELDAANSARQIQDLQNQIAILDSKISAWQNTYSQLLLAMEGSDSTALNVVEEATLPSYPISPNVRMNVLLASAIGLILAAGGAFLIEYLDDTIKDPRDVQRTSNLPTLGAIARIEGEDYKQKLIAVRQPLSPIVEAYRVLRTNLQFSAVDNPAKCLLMTSPGPSEGKSVSLANLAVVMAQSGLKVIVVDTDLRRPVQHRIFGLPNRRGLSDAAIQAKMGIEENLQNTMVENLRLLSSGPLPPNPSELLGSARMKAIVEELKGLADIVLFDSPPTLVVADAAIMSAHVDGVVLVNDAGRTRSTEARRAAEELRRVRANLLGVVLNRLSSGSRGYYYYHYYYLDNGEKKKRKVRKSWLERQVNGMKQPNSKPGEKQAGD